MHGLSGVQYLYVCYTAVLGSFKAPGQPGERPIRLSTRIWQWALRKWGRMFYMTLYKDIYQLFARHTLIVSSETKASVTIIALNEGKMSLFLLNRQFLTIQFRGFLQFFKQNNSKSCYGKSKLLLLSHREYLALGMILVFFFFFFFT